MGLIREPFDVDFFVDSRPLTEKEKKIISDFIKSDKEKRKNKDHSKKGTYTQSGKTPHKNSYDRESLSHQ
jgi:hypothetical protein